MFSLKDTIELLKECDAGIKMGVAAIDDVLAHIDSATLEHILKNSRDEHIRLGEEAHAKLNEYGESDKEPGAVAKGMSKIKTGFRLTANESDSTVADLITDGCNMGIKTVYRYMNQYECANDFSRDLALRLINTEENLRRSLAPYL